MTKNLPEEINYFAIVIKAGEVSDEQLAEFHRTLPEHGQEVFAHINDVRKRFVFVLSQFSGQELLMMRQQFGDHPPVLHSFNGVLSLLEACHFDADTGRSIGTLREVYAENERQRKLLSELIKDTSLFDE
jgi:hypothetical protein